MKKLLIFVLLFQCFLFTSAQVKDAGAMIYKLFATLKEENETAFINLHPNPEQMQVLMRNILTQAARYEKTRNQALSDSSVKENLDIIFKTQIENITKPEAVTAMKKRFSETFQKIIKKGKQKGVNWSKAKFERYVLDTAASTKSKGEVMAEKLGYTAMRGIIDFTAGNSAYQMSFDKIIFIPTEDGWFGGEFKQVVRKGESFVYDEEVSIEQFREIEKVQKPLATIKTKAETKSKTSSAKTKTKIKS